MNMTAIRKSAGFQWFRSLTAPAAAKSQAPAQRPAHSEDTFEPASARRAGPERRTRRPDPNPHNLMRKAQESRWAQLTPMLRQGELDNCGPAVATMLAFSKGVPPGTDAAKMMKAFENQYRTNGRGTTATQLTDMLQQTGLSVTRGMRWFHEPSIDAALKRGGKVALLVDSNAISLGGGKRPNNSAHWVVVDGKNRRGWYQVKNPATGNGYYVPPDHLKKAVVRGREAHQSGGVLIVENIPNARSTRNPDDVQLLGDKPGIGSNAEKVTRESSN